MGPVAAQRGVQADSFGQQPAACGDERELGVLLPTLGVQHRQEVPARVAVTPPCEVEHLAGGGQQPLGRLDVGCEAGLPTQGALDLEQGLEQGLAVAGEELVEARLVALDLGASTTSVEERRRQVRRQAP